MRSSPERSRRRQLGLITVTTIAGGLLMLAMVRAETRAAVTTTPALGRDGDKLPAAPLVVVLPSATRAAERLRPLFERLGLSLPELDPRQLFVEHRVRLGLDPFDRRSLEAAGIDPTGPVYLVDDGTLTHPVVMTRLLPDGLARFEATAVQRVVDRERLANRVERRHRGVLVKGHAAADKAQPRIAYAADGVRLAFAPRGCKDGLDCVAAALRPRRRLTQDRVMTQALTELPDGAALVLARRAALEVGPTRTGRSAAADVEALALSLDVEGGDARLTAQAIPTSAGRQRATGWPPLSGRAATSQRDAGAISIWVGLGARRDNRALQALPYYRLLTRTLASSGISLGEELRALADGGVALHMLDLEPKLPGLDERSGLSDADLAFFIEQGLWVPLRDVERGQDLVRRLDRALERRDGALRVEQLGGAEVHSYAEDGRVTSYVVANDALLVTTGPGSMMELQAWLESPPSAATAGTLFSFSGDADQLRRLLGHVGLLGVGENNDMRAVWVLRQAAGPTLRHLGALSAQLRQIERTLRLEVRAELRGETVRPGGPGAPGR